MAELPLELRQAVQKAGLSRQDENWAKVIGEMAAETELRLQQQMTERLGRQQSKMVAELMALRARVKDLEAQSHQTKGLTYRGVWSPIEQYNVGDFITQDGSMFHCNMAGTRSKPATDGHWTLAVKHGRDLR